MALKIDCDLNESEYGFFNPYFDTDGDFAMCESYDTSILVSLFTDRRANSTERDQPEKRRGWLGDSLSDDTEFHIGSKLWLLTQNRLINQTKGFAVDYIRQSLEWFVSDKIVDQINVSGIALSNMIKCNVELIKNNTLINKDFTNFELLKRSRYIND